MAQEELDNGSLAHLGRSHEGRISKRIRCIHIDSAEIGRVILSD